MSVPVHPPRPAGPPRLLVVTADQDLRGLLTGELAAHYDVELVDSEGDALADGEAIAATASSRLTAAAVSPRSSVNQKAKTARMMISAAAAAPPNTTCLDSNIHPQR